MAKVKRVYWDSGLFISYLSDTHPNEKARADIVVDILKHAQEGEIEIWTSVWTMVEVIRPKSPVPDVFPLPEWAELLNTKDAKGNVRFPKASAHLTQIWNTTNVIRSTLELFQRKMRGRSGQCSIGHGSTKLM